MFFQNCDEPVDEAARVVLAKSFAVGIDDARKGLAGGDSGIGVAGMLRTSRVTNTRFSASSNSSSTSSGSAAQSVSWMLFTSSAGIHPRSVHKMGGAESKFLCAAFNL